MSTPTFDPLVALTDVIAAANVAFPGSPVDVLDESQHRLVVGIAIMAGQSVEAISMAAAKFLLALPDHYGCPTMGRTDLVENCVDGLVFVIVPLDPAVSAVGSPDPLCPQSGEAAVPA